MYDRLRRLTAPPIFDDEDKTRTAKILNDFGWIAMVIMITMILARTKAEWTNLLSLSILIAILLSLLLVEWMIRRGLIREAAWSLVIASWIAMTLQAWSSDGLRDVASISYFITILLTGLLLGWVEGFFVALPSVAAIWFFAYQEQSGLRPINLDNPYLFARDLTFLFLLFGVLIFLLIRNLNRSLNKARLELKERLRAEDNMQTQAQYLSALHDTALGLVNRLELKPLLESVLNRAVELLDTQHVAIDLVLPDESALVQELGFGILAEYNGLTSQKSVGLVGKVWESGRTILTQNYNEWEGHDTSAEYVGFGAVLGTPLKSGPRVTGILTVSYLEHGKQFTDEQVLLIERLAALSSLALDNARLYEQAQSEIRERAAIELALRSSEDLFRKVFNNKNIAISIVTLEDGVFLEANEAFWELSGLDSQNAIGHSILEFQVWQNPESRVQFVNDLLEKGSLHDVQVQYPNKDKANKSALAYYELIHINGRLCILSIFYDISARLQAERAVQESEERFRKVFHASPVAIVITSLEDGRLLDANDAYWKLSGYNPQTDLGKSAVELEMWDLVERRANFVNELKQKKSLYNPSYVFLDLSGRQHHVLAFYELIEIGGVPSILSMFYDITEQKLAQDALQNAELRTRAILQSIPDMIFEISKNGVFLDFITSSETQPIIPPTEFIGKNVNELFSPEISAQTMFALERVFSTGQLHAFEYRLPDEGETSYFEARLSAVNPESAIIMVRDITQRKWVETEREKLISELEGKNSELERFTYTVSHDLKSPLITIKGFLGFLEQDASSGNLTRLKADTKRISDATEKMQSLLNELLELSRIGRVANPYQSIPFNEIASDAVELVQGRLQANLVKVEIQENLPLVHGDRRRLVEVLQNLVDNAAKFVKENSEPQIKIGQDGFEGEIPIFFVKDNGVGIDPAHFERIFGLFDKLDANSDGTGIGLALVKRIVEVHGGRIWVESEPGQGTTFLFTLPID